MYIWSPTHHLLLLRILEFQVMKLTEFRLATFLCTNTF